MLEYAPTKLDSWLKKLLVDPLAKTELQHDASSEFLLSSYGRKYPIRRGIPDLRLLNNNVTHDQKIWSDGQKDYEALTSVGPSEGQEYAIERAGVKPVYDEIPIIGRCLDVGGGIGTLRSFLTSTQEYVTCDPFLKVFENLEQRHKLVEVYPFLLDPVNFVCCDAEFLPFAEKSFDTVHMRSVIDHFLSPELALNEAYRTLREDGVLVVGTFVRGGRSGHELLRQRFRNSVKTVLQFAGIERFRDHHTWHPTYDELVALLGQCGFDVEKVHWQDRHQHTVCYVQARKRVGLRTRFR